MEIQNKVGSKKSNSKKSREKKNKVKKSSSKSKATEITEISPSTTQKIQHNLKPTPRHHSREEEQRRYDRLHDRDRDHTRDRVREGDARFKIRENEAKASSKSKLTLPSGNEVKIDYALNDQDNQRNRNDKLEKLDGLLRDRGITVTDKINEDKHHSLEHPVGNFDSRKVVNADESNSKHSKSSGVGRHLNLNKVKSKNPDKKSKKKQFKILKAKENHLAATLQSLRLERKTTQ